MNDSFTAARAILDSRPDSGPQLVTAHQLIEALGVSAFDLLAYQLALDCKEDEGGTDLLIDAAHDLAGELAGTAADYLDLL